MADDFRRNNLSDQTWALLEPLLSGRGGVWGGVAQKNREFLNAVIWILRCGAPWRDRPPAYGGRKNTHRRFCSWREAGVWDPCKCWRVQL